MNSGFLKNLKALWSADKHIIMRVTYWIQSFPLPLGG